MATDLAILFPFQSTDPLRLANLAVTQHWYAERFPDAEQIVEGDGGCRAGWTKAYAIARAMAQTDATTLVVADSDCLCESTVDAVEQVRSGAYAWASPHTQIRRLDPAASEAVRAGAVPHLGMPLEFKAYAGVAGGGIVVIRRSTWDDAPMDPRFKVTHGEDVAWARGLRFLYGRPWRGSTPLYHLHHPPILAVGQRYKANQRLAHEYRDATSLTIREVIARGQAHVDTSPPTREPARGAVAVVVPVIRRPRAAEPFMRSWAASGACDSHVYAVTDHEDVETRVAWRDAGATALISDRGSTYAQKVNYALEATSEPWLLLVGDDVRFHPGWLQAALEAGERAPVVSTNDLARNDLHQLAVHPMFARSYLEERGAGFDGPGLIAHEGYRHMFVDREWSYLALEREALTFADAARIEHLHPIWGKGQVDEIYQIARDAYPADARLWRIREAQYTRRIKRSPDA